MEQVQKYSGGGGPIGGRLPSVVLDAFPLWAHETRRLAVVHQCIDLLQWPLPGHSPWPLRPRTLLQSPQPPEFGPTPCRPPSSSRRWNGTRQVETWEFVEPSNPQRVSSTPSLSLPSPSQPIPSTVAVSTPALRRALALGGNETLLAPGRLSLDSDDDICCRPDQAHIGIALRYGPSCEPDVRHRTTPEHTRSSRISARPAPSAAATNSRGQGSGGRGTGEQAEHLGPASVEKLQGRASASSHLDDTLVATRRPPTSPPQTHPPQHHGSNRLFAAMSYNRLGKSPAPPSPYGSLVSLGRSPDACIHFP